MRVVRNRGETAKGPAISEWRSYRKLSEIVVKTVYYYSCGKG